MGEPVQHLDFLLSGWPYEFGEVLARVVAGADGRQVLQLRVEMGILQMETTGRPDGSRPGGCDTCYQWLQKLAVAEGNDFVLRGPLCLEIDREFVQYFHRRIAWLALREFDRAVADANHTLALMDFSSKFAPDEEWADMHEQYRPFVLFHRTQAAALAALERTGGAAAIAQIEAGSDLVTAAIALQDEEATDDSELLGKLGEMKSAIAELCHVEPSLAKQLAEAVASEQYELAAQLRDQLIGRQRRDR